MYTIQSQTKSISLCRVEGDITYSGSVTVGISKDDVNKFEFNSCSIAAVRNQGKSDAVQLCRHEAQGITNDTNRFSPNLDIKDKLMVMENLNDLKVSAIDLLINGTPLPVKEVA